MPPRRMVTLEDVAREAGVSVSTASRTLNGRPTKVGAATQARVRAIAQQLGYATNLAAQATALGRSRSIGLIVGGIPEDYQNPVMAGIFRSAAQRDMLVTTAVTTIDDVERTRQTVRQLRGQRPSVIFVVGTEPPESKGMAELIEELRHVEDEGGRVVLIGLTGTVFDTVAVDDYRAGWDMGTSLARMGYREFMVFAGSGSGLLSVHRANGFADALAEQGIDLPPDRVIWQEFSHDGGYRAAGELLRRRPHPEAVFCVNDAMAIGACVRLREHGLVIGEDIAVAGCDDIPALRDIDPPLTTMHLPWIEAAEDAFELATHERSAGRSVILTGHPVFRSSTPERGTSEPAA
jgi:LacI family transcriptional regulator